MAVLGMYPHAPQSHRPTNYWYILALCLAAMLLILWVGLRAMSARFSAGASPPAPASAQPSAAPSTRVTPLASVAPSVAAQASVVPQPTPGGAIDVDAQALQDQPATYRSRVVRVKGTIFYTGKVDAGKNWIQIVGANNVYVDGVSADPLPPGVGKGVDVYVTGIGAGLTNITATNGKDYDQAYIDPIQKIELASP